MAEEVGVWRSPPGSGCGSVSSGCLAGGVGSSQFRVQQDNNEAEWELARTSTAAAGQLDQTMTL
eukprot:1170114-Rhodomonas_salina.1